MPFTLTDFLSAYFVFGLPSWVLGAGMVLGWYISRNKTKILSNNTPSAPKGEFRLECPEPSTKEQRPLQTSKTPSSFDEYVKQVQIDTVRAQVDALHKVIQEEAQHKLSYDKERVADEDLERISKYLHAKRMNEYLSTRGITKMYK